MTEGREEARSSSISATDENVEAKNRIIMEYRRVRIKKVTQDVEVLVGSCCEIDFKVWLIKRVPVLVILQLLLTVAYNSMVNFEFVSKNLRNNKKSYNILNFAPFARGNTKDMPRFMVKVLHLLIHRPLLVIL